MTKGLSLGWTYDRYGNRWAQNASCTSNNCTGISAAQPQLTFGNNNQVSNWVYDADGNLLYDGRNSYTYDAEGRLITLNGQPTYVYDAEGHRVAKLGSNGAVTASYLLGLGGEQVTELNSSGNWVHSNVYAGSRLLATYEGPSGPVPNTYHFHLTDWLGTNRMQTNAAGSPEEACYSYPFGDGLSCTGTDATEQHFTGKERDAESGLDYFFARYYSSDLARFMTPDWAAAPTAVPYATFGDPQTLNLYAYVNNNPNTGIDLDGHVDQNSGENPDANGALSGADNNMLMQGYSGDAGAGDDYGVLSANYGSSSSSGATSDSGKNTGSNTPGTPAQPAPQNPTPTNPTQNQSRIGNIVDNETSGLRAGTANCPGSAQNLHDAKVAIADVVQNRNNAGIKGGVASDQTKARETATPQYHDAQAAASQAARSADATHGSTHFYLNYGQPAPAWAAGRATTTYGPFENAAGGGDVPRGTCVTIVIVH